MTLTSCVANRNVTGIVTGIVTGQSVWSGTVYVDGDVEFSVDSTLRILPGTEVVFLPPRPGQRSEHPFFHGSELIVRGTLIAEGTPAQPIVFRSNDPDAAAGAWGSVNLAESPFASFRYCFFTQADSAVHSQQSRKVTIADSIFENNQVAIRFHSTPIIIKNNLIRRNGTGVRFHFGAPVVSKNQLFENQKGIFITSHPSDYLIEKNHLRGNDVHVVLGEEVPEDIDMQGNYWDSVTPPAASLFFDGRRSSYLGTVKLQPLLTEPANDIGPSWNP